MSSQEITNQEITVEYLQRWLFLFADTIAQKEEYLTELDAAIGDADHGINMRRGTLRLQQRLGEEATNKGISSFLRAVAMTLIGSIGGAAGPLYGSFFLHAAQTAAAQEKQNNAGQNGGSTAASIADSITAQQLADIFRSGLDGVQKRGKARTGEKTMLDAMDPAVTAMEEHAKADEPIIDVLTAACTAAETGMKSTIDMQAKKGRASYLGPRSVGHQDPGATSTYYLFQTALEAIQKTGAETKIAEKSGRL